MSVLIKGMKMPASCVSCVLRFGMRCEAVTPRREIRFKSIYDLGRMDYCPIVKVPTPHGQLIDADALYERFARLESEAISALQTTCIGSVDGIKWSAILTERSGYKFDIADATTIIEAEEVSE